jgi:hypothetical protein
MVYTIRGLLETLLMFYEDLAGPDRHAQVQRLAIYL